MAQAGLGKRILKWSLIVVGFNAVFATIGWLYMPAILGVYMWFPKHPDRPHGSRPEEFEGLWVNWNSNRGTGAAFALTSEGDVVQLDGIAQCRWHITDDKLIVDQWSRCGNGVSWAMSSEYVVTFEGENRMQLIATEDSYRDRNNGWFERVAVNDELKEMLTEAIKKQEHDAWYSAQYTLFVIEDLEARGIELEH